MTNKPAGTGSSLSDALKTAGGVTALTTAIFGVFGFLSVRAAINGLGLPDHAEVSINGYAQYGGRFIFTAAVHLVVLTPALYAAYLLVYGLAKWLKLSNFLVKNRPTRALVVAVVSSVALAVELDILSGTERPHFVVSGQALQPYDEVWLLVLEGAALVSVGTLVLLWRYVWRDWKQRPIILPIIPLLTVLVTGQLLLLPLSFGQISVTPKEFRSVGITMVQSDRQISGRLIFTGNENYFVWLADEQALIQLTKSKVMTIRYDPSN